MKIIWLILDVVFLYLSLILRLVPTSMAVEGTDGVWFFTVMVSSVLVIINIFYPLMVSKNIRSTDSGRILTAVLWAKIALLPYYIIEVIIIGDFVRILKYLLLLSLVSRLSTSVYAIVRIVGLYGKQKLSKSELAVHVILQLFFIADIMGIILLKKRETEEGIDVNSIPIPKHRNGLCALFMWLFPMIFYLGIGMIILANSGMRTAVLIAGIVIDIAASVLIISLSIKMQVNIDLEKNRWIFIAAALTKVAFLPVYATFCIVILVLMGLLVTPWTLPLDFIIAPVAIVILIILITFLSGTMSVPAFSRAICYARKKKISAGICVLHCILLLIPVVGFVDSIVLCFVEGKVMKTEPESASIPAVLKM